MRQCVVSGRPFCRIYDQQEVKEAYQLRGHSLTIQILKLMAQASNPEDGKLPFRIRIFVGLRLEILGQGEFLLEARAFLWRPNLSY